MRGSVALVVALACVASVVAVPSTESRLKRVLSGASMADPPIHGSFPEMTLATPLAPARAWYGHGGWMGFGGAIVSDTKWMAIMNKLMPTVAAAIVKKADVKGMIKGLENNPVCAAFGFDYYTKAGHPVINQPFEWDSFFPAGATEANPQVEQTLVAHGSPLELFKESTWKTNSYGAVERTAATELGGVTATAWRDIFVHALRIARGSTDNSAVTWASFTDLFPSKKFRVVLDVKTGIHQATASFLTAVVKAWATHGVEVVGVGSFNYAQNTGIAAATAGHTKEVWFFHGLVDAGVPIVAQPQLFDVYKSHPEKLANKVVLFNAGFLIRYQRTGVNWFGFARNTKQTSYQIDTAALAELRTIAAKVPGISIGAYVQEYDIDHHALSLLNKMFNEETATFKSGFAWGGKPTAYYADIEPTATDATTGTNGQILFAKVNYL